MNNGPCLRWQTDSNFIKSVHCFGDKQEIELGVCNMALVMMFCGPVYHKL